MGWGGSPDVHSRLAPGTSLAQGDASDKMWSEFSYLLRKCLARLIVVLQPRPLDAHCWGAVSPPMASGTVTPLNQLGQVFPPSCLSVRTMDFMEDLSLVGSLLQGLFLAHLGHSEDKKDQSSIISRKSLLEGAHAIIMS